MLRYIILMAVIAVVAGCSTAIIRYPDKGREMRANEVHKASFRRGSGPIDAGPGITDLKHFNQ